MSKHTPLPWQPYQTTASISSLIVDRTGRVIAEFDNVDNRDFAMKAISEHAALVAVAEAAANRVDHPTSNAAHNALVESLANLAAVREGRRP